jgi:5'-nucleotidase
MISAEIAGTKITKQGRRVYENALQHLADPWHRPCFWIGGGQPSKDREPGTDSYETKNNFISVTPIHLDLTNYSALTTLKKSWIGKIT